MDALVQRFNLSLNLNVIIDAGEGGALSRDEITGIKKAPDVGLFLLLNSGGPDGTRTRDLRRDRPAF